MISITSAALRRGVAAAVFAAGLAAAGPAALAFADPSDTTDFTLYFGTTYDVFQTVNGVTTETVTNGTLPDSETGFGYDWVNVVVPASGPTEETTSALFDISNASGVPVEAAFDPFSIVFFTEPPV